MSQAYFSNVISIVLNFLNGKKQIYIFISNYIKIYDRIDRDEGIMVYKFTLYII